jgi:UPF0042 nucleotide-binding protein
MLMSFGFKYGGPPTANYYFDVGFLKNPAREFGFWSEASEVADFILEQPAAQAFISVTIPLMRLLVTVDQRQIFAFGCSAGRHRSTVLVTELARRLAEEGIIVDVQHRDLG